jgi:hypothetical protein
MKILLVARHREREKICRYEASESMLQGLEEAGIEYDIHPPWEPFQGDLQAYDAALVWAYQGQKKNFIFWARRFEARCRREQLPVVNSVDGCFYAHSTGLARWKAAGVLCADFQHFTTADDLRLRFPMILRTDGVHEGRNTHLVHSREEAARVIDENQRAYAGQPRRKRRKGDDAVRLLDLAIEFHDVRAADGFCHKRRTIVVGDTLIHREHSVSSGWLVNLNHRVHDEYVQKLNQEFFATGDRDRDALLAATRALGTDTVALDYTKLADGRLMFWEGNRHFKMHGNKAFKEGDINSATGRTYQEMLDVDRAVGRAVVTLLEKTVRQPVAG